MRLPASSRSRMIAVTLGKLPAVAATLALMATGAPAAEQSAPMPLAARSSASGEARLPPPPERLEIPAGQTSVTAMGTVAADRPAVFLFAPPAGAMLSIAVASKTGDARLSLYEPGATTAVNGTSEQVGAIKWIGTLTRPGDHRVVIHTRGAETPIRVEVKIERAAGDKTAD
jgi:hypothetical protein